MASTQSNVDWQSTKKTVSERTRHMFNNPDMSDVNFTCEDSDKTFYAHKYVLGTSSVVFRVMFYGDMAEKNPALHLGDTDEKSLEVFLRFLYTDECNLAADNVVSVMYLSKKYMVKPLAEECVSFLERGMEPDNVLTILEQAIYFDEKELETKCWKVVEWHIKEIVSLECFNNINQKTLASLLKRNGLIIREIGLFKAVLNWSDFQCLQKGLDLTTENRRSVIGEGLYDLRLLAMTEKEFSKHVITSGLLTSDEIKAIQGKLENVDSSIQEKLKGMDLTAFKWPLGIRKEHYDMLVFKRLDRQKAGGWEYNGQPDCLCFSVDRDVLFHGVRLYGDIHNSQYKVTFEIEGVKVKGTYKSKENVDGFFGFCVMLKLPVVIRKNRVVKMSATIKGPSSSYGYNKIVPLKVDGVTVTFIDAELPNNDTWIYKGQFHKILLSI